MSAFDESKLEIIHNSLSSLVTGFSQPYVAQVSKQDTLYKNVSWDLISNNRTLLSQAYTKIGIIQTLVDQPVDDGFRNGFEIVSNDMSPEEIEELYQFADEIGAIRAIIQGNKWARLFGGGGVFIVTDEDPATEFKPERLKKGQPIAFRAFDMWEMYYNSWVDDNIISLNQQYNQKVLNSNQNIFDYYGHKINRTRVMKMDGKQAPSFVRQRLMGWGMSEVERILPSLNQFLKNNDVIFELIDEAKIDIYKIENFNASLLTETGTKQIQKRVQLANMIKNFQNAIVMDKEDEYDQKQLTFAGLPEMCAQNRIGIASDVKMPMTKLFGLSAAGFNAGEDDIENYNSMIESEVRAKVKSAIVYILKVCAQVRFGRIPEDMKIVFPPLRVMSAEQEENIKKEKFARIMLAKSEGLISTKQAQQAINKDNLLPIEIDETEEELEINAEEEDAP